MTDTASIDPTPTVRPENPRDTNITAPSEIAAANAAASVQGRAEPDGAAARPPDGAAAGNVVPIAAGRAAPGPDEGAESRSSACSLAEPLRCARPAGADRTAPCAACGQNFTESIPISELRVGKPDEMQNIVLEIYWVTSTFKVYRTVRGVFVHFAECGRLEEAQRIAFDALYVPLSSLRFLTSRMFRFRARSSSFYDHETAQAIVQALHGRAEAAVTTLNQLHALALDRVANENRVRYLLACVATGLVSGGIGVLVLSLLSTEFVAALFGAGAAAFRPYVLAAIMGGLGAVFSIAMSVRSLEMMPSQHSFMNYVIAAVRVLTGFMSGAMLVLLLTSNLLGDLGQQLAQGEGGARPISESVDWAKVAMLGLLAGFAERMVPDLMGGASNRFGPAREKTAGAAPDTARSGAAGADTKA